MTRPVLLAAVAAAVSLHLAASALAADADRTITNQSQSSGVEQTPEQLRHIKPMPWYQPPNLPPAGSQSQSEPKEGATPGRASGGPPNPNADEAAKSEFPRAWQKQSLNNGAPKSDSAVDASSPITDAGTKDVYTPYCANCSPSDRTIPPHRAIGLLTTNRGSCSASVISGNNIIVTAAHCCYTRGTGWNSNFRFYPAYKSGQFPTYGSFPSTSARILNTWISRGAREDDVCLISLANNQFGRPVTFYTGWLGRQWDWPTIRSLHALGYPANIDNGNSLQLCAAESFGASAGCGGASVLNMGCNMTNGSSGGPWINGYRGGNWVNSVVSGYDNSTCTGTFGQTFNGPRFTSANIVTLCNAQGC